MTFHLAFDLNSNKPILFVGNDFTKPGPIGQNPRRVAFLLKDVIWSRIFSFTVDDLHSKFGDQISFTWNGFILKSSFKKISFSWVGVNPKSRFTKNNRWGRPCWRQTLQQLASPLCQQQKILTHDMWHVTHGRFGSEGVLKIYSQRIPEWLNPLVRNPSVCKRAPATPGLLNILNQWNRY